MSSLQSFGDFVANTKPAFLTGPDKLVVEARKRQYLLADLIEANANRLQGGESIRETLIFDESRTYQKYKPDQTLTYRNPQVTKEIKGYWRFSLDHMSWNDQEVTLNGASAEATALHWKRLKKIKETRLAVSMLNGMEEDLFRPAIGNASAMEAQGGLDQYSISVFVHETVTSTPDGFRGGLPPGWSTILGISPTGTDWRFTNQVVLYDPQSSDPNADPTSKVATGHNAGTHDVYALMSAFDAMWLRVHYRSPKTLSQYWDEVPMRAQKILCSLKGMEAYRRALRGFNDRLVGAGNPQDPAYTTPTYSGVPLTHTELMGTETMYPRASGSVTDTFAGRNGQTALTTGGGSEFQAETIDKGPRYLFINGEFLAPYIHTERWLKRHPIITPSNQPFNRIMPVDSWWNLMVRSRQRHGIVAPLRAA